MAKAAADAATPRRSLRSASPLPRGRDASPAPVRSLKSPKPAKPAAARKGFFSRHDNIYIYVPNLIGA